MSDASPAGWHPDPRGRHEHRYWDGTQWTDHVADAGVMATDPVAEVAPVAAPIGPSMVNLPAITPDAVRSSAEPEPEPEPEPASGSGPLWSSEESMTIPPTEPEREPEPEPEPEPTAVHADAEPAPEPAAAPIATAGGERSPDLAALLSVVAPGAGHIYLGRATGIAYGLLAATVLAVILAYFSFLLFIVGLVIWAGAAAYALTDLRGGLAGLRDTRLSAHLVGWVLVAAGAAMIVSLVLPWYHVNVDVNVTGIGGISANQSKNASGFQSFEFIDIVVLIAGAASVLAGLAALGKGPISSDELPPAMPAIVAGLALLALVLTYFRLFVDPVPSFGGLGSAGSVDISVGRGPGGLLAAASAIAILAASVSLLTAPRHQPERIATA
jgi:TM2 domain-containing membrane protein YozV